MGSIPVEAPRVRVLIAGGSYGGLATALNLLDLGDGLSPRMAYEPVEHHPDVPKVDYDITIVDERDGFYHTIGSPLALADSDYAKKAWVKYTDIPALQTPKINILHGSLTHLDPATKTASVLNTTTQLASTHTYDYFVAATGLRRVWPVVPQSFTRKQYLLEAEEQIHAVNNARDGVPIVGGGAVGIEMAAELKMMKPEIKVTLAHSRDKLLSSEGLKDDCKEKAKELLEESGVQVLLNHRLVSKKKLETGDGVTRYEVEFTNGHKMIVNDVTMAISKSEPSTSYMPKSALDEEGYIKINPNLTLVEGTPNASSHYCAGDACKWSGIKRCGAAMHGGHYSAYNIHQSVVESAVNQKAVPKELQEVPPMIGLAVGKQAVASGPEQETIWGEDVLKLYFKHDLGFTICWDYMQLGGKKVEVAA